MKKIVNCVFLAVCLSGWLNAADPVFSKEDRIRDLKLKEALLSLEKNKNTMETQRKEFQENQKLYSNKVITLKTLNDVQREYETAVYEYKASQIDLENTKMDFLKDSVKIGIEEAVKYSRREGEMDVWVTIKNISKINYHVRTQNPNNWQELLNIQNITVSIKDLSKDSGGGAIICEPFEKYIDLLKYQEKKKLVFRLLKKEVESVTVSLKYLNLEDQKNVYLKKKSLLDIPTLNLHTINQQGELGETIEYGFDLERLAEDEKSFNIYLLGLPLDFDFRIISMETKASTSLITIGGKRSKQTFAVEIILPEKIQDAYLEQEIPFYLVVMQMVHVKQLSALQKKYHNKTIPLQAIKKLKGNYAELFLTPVGAGELKLQLPKKYEEISSKRELEIKLNVENSGSILLRNVALKCEVPAEWMSEIDPQSLPQLEIKEKEYFQVKLTLPDDVGFGEYDISFYVRGEDRGRIIESKDSTYTVKIVEKTDLLITIIIIIIIIGIILVVAVGTVKMAKR